MTAPEKSQLISRNIIVCQYLWRFMKILIDLHISAKICQDPLRSTKICQDLLRSDGLCEDLLGSVKICNDQIYLDYFVITLTFWVAADPPEKEWLMAIEMFISQKTARDWMSLSLLFTKKEKFARHLKKDL